MRNEIKKVRQSMGLTQDGFAKLLGVTRMHYNCVENGRCDISIKLLEKVAKISGKRLVYIFIDKDENVPDF